MNIIYRDDVEMKASSFIRAFPFFVIIIIIIFINFWDTINVVRQKISS